MVTVWSRGNDQHNTEYWHVLHSLSAFPDLSLTLLRLLGASKGWSLTIASMAPLPSSFWWTWNNGRHHWEIHLFSQLSPYQTVSGLYRSTVPVREFSPMLCVLYLLLPLPLSPESRDLPHSYQPREAPSCLTEFPYACWYLGRLLPHYTLPHVPHCGTPSAF